MKVDTGWLVFCAAIGLAGYLTWRLLEVGVPVLMVSSTDPAVAELQSPADRPSNVSEVAVSRDPSGSESVLRSNEADAPPNSNSNSNSNTVAADPSRRPLSIDGSAAVPGNPGDPSAPSAQTSAADSRE